MKKKLPIHSTLTIASLIMVAPAALAQATATTTADDGLSFQARLGIEHDSNVLRQSGGAISDTAWTAGVGLRYDRQFSLQRLRADVQWDTWRYNDASQLNFNTLNYALAWDWAVTPRFTGTVSADRRQYREVTTDPTGTVNRIGRRTERTELVEGGFGGVGPFRIVAGASRFESESSVPGSWDANPEIRYWHLGASYSTPAGSSITLRHRRGDGEYTDPVFLAAGPLNSDFRDDLTEVVVRWSATGKTTVDGRLGHLKRRHDLRPALDFDGMVGALNVTWDITGKTRLVGGWQRDVSASGLAQGGHVDSDRFYIAPVWQATGKTSFNLRYDHTRRDWENVPALAPGFGRSEKLESFQVGVDWEALRTITVSGYARRERMKSSVNAGYRANVYGVIARANF